MYKLTEQDKLMALPIFSNYEVAKKKTHEYLGNDVELLISPRKDKKYRVYDPINRKWVDFGQMGYEDATLHQVHQDEKRRQRYLKRATKIKGDWKSNPYSPNNLSINILW